jgi:hypothetical protein
MALFMPIDIADTGVTAEYWRLTHVQADLIAGIVDAQLHGYRDADARRAGRQPLSRMSFRFPITDIAEADAIELSRIYAAIREMPAGVDEDGAATPPVFASAADA